MLLRESDGTCHVGICSFPPNQKRRPAAQRDPAVPPDSRIQSLMLALGTWSLFPAGPMHPRLLGQAQKPPLQLPPPRRVSTHGSPQNTVHYYTK